MSSAVEIEITDQILGVQDYPDSWTYPLVMSKKLLKMSIEIVEIPIKHGDFPYYTKLQYTTLHYTTLHSMTLHHR